MKSNRLINIQEHCFRLRELLSQLDWFKYRLAIDWLDIAAGVESVKVTTAKYDSSTMYCRGAFEYEGKRSELLSQLTTKLTIFNFVWGSFETIAKTFKLSGLPDGRKPRENNIVNRTIWFLKQNYDSEAPLAFYHDKLCTLRRLIEGHEFYIDYSEEIQPPDFVGLNGWGLHIVRNIRNALAHGSAGMPRPDDWGEEETKLSPAESRHLNLVDTSTRVVLFTIQMFLLAHLRGEGITVECLLDEEDDWIESTAERALREIHLQPNGED